MVRRFSVVYFPKICQNINIIIYSNEQNYKISINLKKTTEAMPYIHCYVALIIMKLKLYFEDKNGTMGGWEYVGLIKLMCSFIFR